MLSLFWDINECVPSLLGSCYTNYIFMDYHFPKIAEAAKVLKNQERLQKEGLNILRAPELKSLYAEIPKLPESQRAGFGKEVNNLKNELTDAISNRSAVDEQVSAIDITAPFDDNTPMDRKPRLLESNNGSKHPLTRELENILDIFYRMGFTAVESRQVDDDYHMFSSLNFPEGHPARDDYDTFMSSEGLIAPAHTSTMQNRVLKKYKAELERGKPISVVIPGRTFRNEDVDARHDHTFNQIEGVYVDKGINAGHLLATFKSFLEEYFAQEIEIRSQPFYFPFTEPSFELALSCPFCQKKGCNVCSYTGWIELLGMGMIHPNVLKMADINPDIYTGFAWGFGVERLVMMKFNIEDIRHFEAAKLEFLRQFK